jgi:hypothetical protein
MCTTYCVFYYNSGYASEPPYYVLRTSTLSVGAAALNFIYPQVFTLYAPLQRAAYIVHLPHACYMAINNYSAT